MDEGRYDCPHCGEEIVVPVDVPAGETQDYVEDCPVCCSPVVIRVRIDAEGRVTIQARAE